MKDNEIELLQSGALNPEKDPKSFKVANVLYKEFRNRNKFSDCEKIANHTRFSIEQIVIIRDYIFENCHWLRDGRFRRFDPDYAMAESWRQLTEKDGLHIEPHDVLMLEHELYEIDILLRNSKYSVTMAHEIAKQRYNYSKVSTEYYEKLFSKQKKDADSKKTELQEINVFKS